MSSVQPVPLHTPLGSGVEFDRIRSIWDRLGERAAPMGEDCALMQVGSERLAVSIDASVEGTHFVWGWLSPEELGWRAAAAALSDLAAVAAEPCGVMVSVGLPADWPDSHLVELMDGVGQAAAAVGAKVWGGDLVRSSRILIDVSAVGRLDGEPVRRGGARAGDGIWVTGRLGGPLAALSAWRARREPDSTARERFAHPEARVREARWLRDRGARAMIDVSDGLAADAGHLAAASGVRVTLEADLVPVHPSLEAAELALVSGEEYELLLALPPDAAPSLSAEFEQHFGMPLTLVGKAESGSAVRVVRNGSPIEVPRGFQHF